MKFRPLVSVASVLVVLGLTSVAGAQNLPACRPTARVCNDVAGLDRHASDRFVDVPVSQPAAALPACTAADQPSVGDCDATLRRHNRQGRIIAVTVPTGGGVLALDPTPQPPAAPRAPSGRDRTARREIEALRPYVVTGYNNTLVLDAGLRSEAATRHADDLQLLANQRQLQQQQAATQQQVYGVGFQVHTLREEWRIGIAPAFRYTYQPGGSPTLGLGLGFTLSHWAQGSDFGIEGDVAFYGFQSQPLVPGRTPLFGASAGVHGIYGRGIAQLLFGASGGMSFRFGDANPGEVTGGTAFNLGLGGGVRLEMPLRPVSRPDGARFFGQATVHFGGGGVNALARGQDPLHLGFVVDLQLQAGFRF